MWSTLVFGGTTFLFAAWMLSSLFHLRWVRRLPELRDLNELRESNSKGATPARCSVVIAARDEEERIEGTVTHALAVTGVELEVIVVDDRSTDRTNEILRRLAAKDERLQVLRIDILPDGWLGKSHACHVGASQAKGDWLLFTDADCWLKHDVVLRAIRVAGSAGVDHITLTPGVSPITVGARAWHLAFISSVLNWISNVNRDRPGSHLGVGAFNLMRADAYRRCGGYEALRMCVVDDVKLGLLLRRAGNRTRAFLGSDDVECHWGRTVGGMIKIMEKNYFAAADFRLWVVVGGTTIVALLIAAVVMGLLSRTPVGLMAGLSPLLSIITPVLLTRRIGWSPWCAVVTPFVYPVLFYALVNSTWVTMHQGGIRWRGTFYPLEALRRGNVV